MCIICHLPPDTPYLGKSLECYNCPLLTSLPSLPLVTTLYCSGCPLLRILTSLPSLPLVTSLDCSNCPLLTSLPDLPLVTSLYCYNCPLLTSLPDLPLETNLNCSLCKWLDYPTNKDFTKNIKSLKTIQRYKKNRKALRFVKLTTSRRFNEFFFSKEGLGGIWHVKNMMERL